MKEFCPKCGFRFGWRGPVQKSELSRWATRVRFRYFCPSCSIELEHRWSRAEQLFMLIGALSGLLAAGAHFWQQSFLAATPPGAVSAWGYFVSSVAFLAALFLNMRRQHYVIAVYAQLGAPADAPKAARR